jgi:2-polyprenyl-3-methyl-5-hydroxy-6-metoxy-1,4-benzoquinol methylase
MLTIDFRKLGLKKGDKILDIGCGEGRHTIRACQTDGLVCAGADFGFLPLVQTRKKLEFHRALNDISCASIDLVCTDITSLPFGTKSFDCVICSEVLEHIPNDAEAISELARIVKPGGTLAVSVPRFWPEKICWVLSDEYFNANMGHVRIYRKKNLVKSIESHDFSLFASHHAHSIHSPFWWLKCFTGPSRTDCLPVNLYHRLLVWDMMKKPRLTVFIDRLLNPVLGKSLVLYFKKRNS